jgi:GTP-binding protein HflX
LDRISRIKKDILEIQKRRANQRKNRRESPVPVAALVGYTSVGKSTLFNQLSRESTWTSAQLFATLDPVLRRVSYPDGSYFFLSDTVGFIKKLPVELITSFKATLEEVSESDCILHVIDSHSLNTDSQVQAVEKILTDLGITDIPVVQIFNKIDLLPNKQILLEKNKSSDGLTVYISAKTGEGIPSLKEKLKALLFKNMQLFYLRVPKEKEEMLASFPHWSLVLERRENGDSFDLKIMAKPDLVLDFLPYLKRGEENC